MNVAVPTAQTERQREAKPGRNVPSRPRSKGLVVGHLVGAPIILTPSWFLSALVLTAIFAPNVVRVAPTLSPAGVAGAAFGFACLLALSVFLHEAAHALMANRQGQRVHELAVTLWGGHTAFSNQIKSPGSAALVAIVGPITNLLLAGIFYASYQMMPRGTLLSLLFYAAFFSNAFVGFFNLLPGLPLDGGQILEALVWGITGWRTRGTIVAGWVGRLVALGLVVWQLTLPLTRGLSINPTSALWMLMIAGFLWQGSSQSISIARRREKVSAYAARNLALSTLAVPVTSTVYAGQMAVANASNPEATLCAVDDQGRPIGWIDKDAMARVPQTAVTRTPITAALVPFAPGSAVPIALTGLPLLAHIDATSGGSRLVPVVDAEGHLAGVIDIGQLAAALSNVRTHR